MALQLQVAVIVVIQLLRVINVWPRMVHIPFRAVDLVGLILGVIQRPGCASSCFGRLLVQHCGW